MKKDYKYGKPFKFKSLELFVSTERMANKKRKFRNVFDVNEIDYLRFQFLFYNKLFDEEEWSADFKLIVKDNKGTEKCSLNQKVKVKKTQNTVAFNKGWGTDKYGGFWDEGQYVLSAYVDDEFVVEKKFYIYKNGVVNQTYNPYFEVDKLNFFEGPKSLPKDKKYLKIFKKDSTKYIWVDFSLKNKFKKNWRNEVFIYIFDDAGQLKTTLREEYVVDVAKNEIISLYTGWGNEEGGSWEDDKYYVNVVFMDTLVASSSFKMGEKNVAGSLEMTVGESKTF
ncbi:MAG: hypothetical protein U9Q83_04025, partial [Bacteroidota bacterium]|nr:hypothetical protein [Bacteroidota bacterium]